MEFDFSWAFAALCVLAFFAGLVDSVIGGGGLIQVPALLVMLPGVPVATIFGTNKIISVAGTTAALAQIARNVTVPWRMLLAAAIVGAIFAFIGARSVTLIDPALLKPIILLLLIAVAIYTFVVSFILCKVLKSVMGLRASEEAEDRGLDLSLHGEEAYAEASSG